MSIEAILLPAFVEAGLIFAICFFMIYARNAGARSNPERGKLAGDSFRNQFELPVLYFALIPLAILTRKADHLFILMSWLFVLSRIAHAYVHVTSNRQPARGMLWLAGALVLLLMWIIFALAVLFPPALPPLPPS